MIALEEVKDTPGHLFQGAARGAREGLAELSVQIKVSKEDGSQFYILLPCPSVEVLLQVESTLTDEAAVGVTAKVLDGCCHLGGQRMEERGESGTSLCHTVHSRCTYGQQQGLRCLPNRSLPSEYQE